MIDRRAFGGADAEAMDRLLAIAPKHSPAFQVSWVEEARYLLNRLLRNPNGWKPPFGFRSSVATSRQLWGKPTWRCAATGPALRAS